MYDSSLGWLSGEFSIDSVSGEPLNLVGDFSSCALPNWLVTTNYASTMKILLLGEAAGRVHSSLSDWRTQVFEEPLEYLGLEHVAKFDMILSFGFRHLIRDSFLEALAGQAFNVHISLLPWNRGADPNFWSWVTNTPKGVTIHQIDSGIDTGPIIAQKQATLNPQHTLRSTYDELIDIGIDLVLEGIESFPSSKGTPQQHGGSHHHSGEIKDHLGALPLGWDTRCQDVLDYGEAKGLWVS